MDTEKTPTELQNAIDVLAKPWNDVLSPHETGTGKYVAIDYPPLLDMLYEARHSSLGKTVGGKSPDAERNILNLAAFTLWEHIDGTVRAWFRELSKSRAPEDLKTAMIELGGIIKAAHASGQMKDSRYGHMSAMFPRWQAQIWELFDPPVVKELIGECPNCEARIFVSPVGEQSPALTAFYWKGIRPEAKCQCCGEHWVGEAQLISLGKVLGATMDEDALREMGAIA